MHGSKRQHQCTNGRLSAVPRDNSQSLIISSRLNHVPLDHSSATDLARRSNAGVVASAERKGGVDLWGTSSSAIVERKPPHTAPFHPNIRLTSHVFPGLSFSGREKGRFNCLRMRLSLSSPSGPAACAKGNAGKA